LLVAVVEQVVRQANTAEAVVVQVVFLLELSVFHQEQ
jgi:hypothetical protein